MISKHLPVLCMHIKFKHANAKKEWIDVRDHCGLYGEMDDVAVLKDPTGARD